MGSSATMRIASMARDSSVATVTRLSSFVHVGGREVLRVRVVRPDPRDLELAEVPRLGDVDEPPLVELEHGEEAHDDLEPVVVVAGELPEGCASGARQLADELLEGVAHVRPDGSHVIEVDARRRLGREGLDQRLGEIGGGDAGEDVGCQVYEAVLEAGNSWVRTAGEAGEPLELAGGVLARLALEQASQQGVALGVELELLVEVCVVVAGQQTLG